MWVRLVRGVVALRAALLLVTLLPGTALAIPTAAERAEIQTAIALGDSATLRRLIIAAGTRELITAHAKDGPIVGTAPTEEFLRRRPEVWMDPAYWSSYVREVLLNAHVMLPMPIDPVKPEAYLPNVPVTNGDYVSALPRAVRDISGITYRWLGETKTVQQYVHSTETDGLAIVQNGRLVGEIYANGYSAEVRHQPWSVTKTFIAATFGIARMEGLVPSLQAPVESYLPELSGTAWAGATLENILQMESGVHWDEGTPVLVINTQVQQWVDMALDYYSAGRLGQTRNEFLQSLPKAYVQGEEFRYNSGNTQVLAWVLERLYGKPYNLILQEKLWQPMGAAGDAVMISDRLGDVVASQGLYARPYDFARFGELMRNGGRTPEGRRVLSAEWIRAMTQMTAISSGQYGYQTWDASDAGAGAYTASGFQGQKITVLPGSCISAVRLSHQLGGDLRRGDDPVDRSAYGFSVEMGALEFNTMLKAVAAELGGCAGAPRQGVQNVGTGGGGFAAPVLVLLLLAVARRIGRHLSRRH